MDTPAGWVETAMADSIRRTVLVGLALWQLVNIAAAVAAPDLRQPTGLIVALHAALAILLLAAAKHPGLIGAAVAAAYGVALNGFVAATSFDGVMCLGATWLTDLVNIVPGLVMTRRGAITTSVTAAVVLPVGIALAHPEWGPEFPPAVAFTTLATAAATWLAMPGIRRLAEHGDRAAREAANLRRATVHVEAATRRAAEDARILHDTVINTLGAIANGPTAPDDAADVRHRCALDLATVEAILRPGYQTARAGLDVRALRAHSAIGIETSGLHPDNFNQSLDGVPPFVADALGGAVAEAVLNASKHSGGRRVDLVLDHDPGVWRVQVSDDGSGYDAATVPGRGISESILARCAEAGITVEIETAPGRGTQVTYTYTSQATVSASRDGAATTDDRVPALLERAGWFLAAGIVAVGVALELVNRRGQITPTHGMLALDAVGCGVAWVASRGRGRLPGPCVALLIAVVPPAFLCALAATDFGRSNVVYWQAIGVTAPLVVLAAASQRVVWARTGILTLAATALVTALAILPDSAERAVVVLVGAAPAVLLATGWLAFMRILRTVGARAAADFERVQESRRETIARQADRDARERWQTVGLRTSADLLAGMADGSLDPGDLTVQHRCADEERYLRGVLQLSPDAIWLGPWLGRALTTARAQQVRLTVRTGHADASDAQVAERLGALIVEAVGAAPAASDLTVSVFERGAGLQVTLVGQDPLPDPVPEDRALPDGWRLQRSQLGLQKIVELTERGSHA